MEAAADLILSVELRDQLVAHARDTSPREAVGIVGGTLDGWAAIAIPLRNIAPDDRSFLADPFEQYRALRRIAAEKLHLLAIYHSHPDGGLEPSAVDIAHARRWACAHLVISFGTTSPAAARLGGYRCTAGGALEKIDVRIQERRR